MMKSSPLNHSNHTTSTWTSSIENDEWAESDRILMEFHPAPIRCSSSCLSSCAAYSKRFSETMPQEGAFPAKADPRLSPPRRPLARRSTRTDLTPPRKRPVRQSNWKQGTRMELDGRPVLSKGPSMLQLFGDADALEDESRYDQPIEAPSVLDDFVANRVGTFSRNVDYIQDQVEGRFSSKSRKSTFSRNVDILQDRAEGITQTSFAHFSRHVDLLQCQVEGITQSVAQKLISPFRR